MKIGRLSKNMDSTGENPVRVIKNGRIVLMKERKLSRGDTVVLQSGDIIPADIRLIFARNLEVDEFDLTGEIKPTNKKVSDRERQDLSLDRTNMVFRGTRVLRGIGRGIVTAVGEETEYGKILLHSSKTLSKKSDLLRFNIYTFLKQHLYLQVIVLPAFILAAARGVALKHLIYAYLIVNFWLMLFEERFIFNYISIAAAYKYLLKRNIVTKNSHIFDTMGDIDVVCFDKTGVITSRDMKVTSLYIDKNKIERQSLSRISNLLKYIIQGCALCNDIVFLEGLHLPNRIDMALINFAQENGVSVEEIREGFERVFEIPFESEKRYMMTGYRKDDELLFYIKGDPEVVLKMCRKYMGIDGTIRDIDGSFMLNIGEAKNEILKKGNSVIAMAFKMSAFSKQIDYEREAAGGYVFLNLFVLENPPKQEARFVIDELHKKRKKVLMLTGDITATAVDIAERAGIIQNAARYFITGRDMEKMSTADIAAQSEYVRVFSRLAPSQKGIIIEAVKRRGHKVAMVGDGPNDVIALKLADISISFREHSSILAQNVSDILIKDDLKGILWLMKIGAQVKAKLKTTDILRKTALVLLSSLIYYSSYAAFNLSLLSVIHMNYAMMFLLLSIMVISFF